MRAGGRVLDSQRTSRRQEQPAVTTTQHHLGDDDHVATGQKLKTVVKRDKTSVQRLGSILPDPFQGTRNVGPG